MTFVLDSVERKARPSYRRPIQASRLGAPVRLTSTPSVAHFRLEGSTPDQPSDPARAGAGEDALAAGAGDEVAILVFFFFSASTIVFHLLTISDARRATCLSGFVRCLAMIIPAFVVYILVSK
jgi:hypothetical protein